MKKWSTATPNAPLKRAQTAIPIKLHPIGTRGTGTPQSGPGRMGLVRFSTASEAIDRYRRVGGGGRRAAAYRDRRLSTGGAWASHVSQLTRWRHAHVADGVAAMAGCHGGPLTFGSLAFPRKVGARRFSALGESPFRRRLSLMVSSWRISILIFFRSRFSVMVSFVFRKLLLSF